jgi:hypothetical protein
MVSVSDAVAALESELEFHPIRVDLTEEFNLTFRDIQRNYQCLEEDLLLLVTELVSISAELHVKIAMWLAGATMGWHSRKRNKRRVRLIFDVPRGRVSIFDVPRGRVSIFDVPR